MPRKLTACFSAKNTDVSMSALERLVVSDRFQTRSRCEFRRMEKMPRTASGDIDRAQLEAQHESRRNRAGRVLPRNEIERTIAQIWGELLRAPNIGVHDNFFELGGDSILAIQAIARANQAGLKFVPAQLFQHQTIAGLASVCELSGSTTAEQSLVQGPAPLTPIQRWFFEQDLPEKHHFNMSLMLTVKDDLNLSCLAAAVDRVVVHHDALRLRYEQAESGWSQWHAALEDCRIGESFQHVDISEVPATRQSSEIENIAAGFQSSLDLSKGPLLRVVYMTLGAGRPGRLLIIVHHLVMDGISWRILLQDMFTAYEQLSRGSAVALPPKTTSFQAWAKGLAEWSRSEQSHAGFSYWQGLGALSPSPIPRDHSNGANTVAHLSSVAICFSEEETLAVLQDVPRLYHTQINDVLLTALAQAFACWTGQRSLYLDLEGHGREDVLPGIDISRTVGWFTSLFPVRLELGPVQHVGEELKAVKEELRRLPHRGMSYGVLRYLSDNPAIRQALESLPPAEISFNYLGQIDRSALENAPVGLDAAPESFGAAFSAAGKRPHLIDVIGIIAAGKLRLEWAYSSAVYDRATIEYLANRYADALRGIIAHCKSPDAGGYTPSDFPLAGLDNDGLSQVLMQVEFDTD
jgi:non-ribosomal peptide synthase protein (TIGR01720 family)